MKLTLKKRRELWVGFFQKELFHRKPVKPAKSPEPEHEGYREVNPDEILPIGSQIIMDLKTGKNYVKIKEAEKKNPSV